jgi:protein-L-isoaspartate(D-aspartate) O-methyltransferase
VRSTEDLVQAALTAGVRDQRILTAVRSTPRAAFLAGPVAHDAYRDIPIPTRHGQTTSQPSLIALMLEWARVGAGDRVLEVGTGSGWQTALLARLAASVWSIERLVDIAADARARLAEFGIENAVVVAGDGTQGLPEKAPFDVVIVSAAFPVVPRPLADQLAMGGRLVQPMGKGGSEDVVVFERGERGLEPRWLIARARFVPLHAGR